MEPTTIATHPKGFALMKEDLQPEITVNSKISWGGKASVHDRLGEKPVLMIGREAESMRSQTIGSKRWLIRWFLMRTSCVGLLNVDARCNWMMKGQAKHVRSPIHSGV
jgi:hypothetical protein